MTSPVLDRHAVAAWREIAERHAAGELWVTRVSALLHHLWRRECLRFQTRAGEDAWVIALEGLADGDQTREVAAGDLDGIAFTVPQTAPEVRLIARGMYAPIATRREAESRSIEAWIACIWHGELWHGRRARASAA